MINYNHKGHSKRKTKESILQDTIQYIKELQQEIAIKKRKKTIGKLLFEVIYISQCISYAFFEWKIRNFD